jgi:nucleotide-binding universal stress UspA family protein
MSVDVIVSYDGTANDEDALALGKLLSAGGASLALAYVRHAHEWDPRRDEIAQHDAESLLARGALGLGNSDVERHVVLNASTPAGLRDLAEREGAAVIVFGSEYRTSPGRAEPGTSAQILLDGGPVAVAVAAAGLRVQRKAGIETVGLATPGDDAAGEQAARTLADRLGATLLAPGGDADLVVVGSKRDGPPGRISLSGGARAALNAVRGSVLVVPVGAPLRL